MVNKKSKKSKKIIKKNNKKCPKGKYLNPLTNRCIKKQKKKEKKIIKKKCEKGKILNLQTNRCIKKTNKKRENVIDTLRKIKLKKGELSNFGYKDVKNLSLKKRRKSLNNAVEEYGAPKILKKY